MKIIDSFSFMNELTLLEIRMHELYPLVDYFVIVESETTFSGLTRELVFPNNKDRFKKYEDKIIYKSIDNYPFKSSTTIDNQKSFKNEAHHRHEIGKCIKDINLNDNDIVLLGDVDEIPSRNKLKNILETNMSPLAFVMHGFYYNFKGYRGDWTGTVLYESKDFLQRTPSNEQETKYKCPLCQMKCVEEIRRTRQKVTNKAHCGWHLSYFGDAKYIKNKINSFAHQEINTPGYISKIENSLNSNVDFIRNKPLANPPEDIDRPLLLDKKELIF